MILCEISLNVEGTLGCFSKDLPATVCVCVCIKQAVPSSICLLYFHTISYCSPHLRRFSPDTWGSQSPSHSPRYQCHGPTHFQPCLAEVASDLTGKFSGLYPSRPHSLPLTGSWSPGCPQLPSRLATDHRVPGLPPQVR